MAVIAVLAGDDGTIFNLGAIGLPAATTIGGSSVAALTTITSTTATALTTGRNGATNPSFNVDNSTTLAVTGINIKAAAAASGIAITVTSTGTDESITYDAKGAGTFTLNGTATGNVIIGHGLTGSVQTLTGAGAVNLTTTTTQIVTTAANALTLANGAHGQIKTLAMITDGGDGTLTPTTKTGYSTIVFNDAGDGCILQYFTTLGWIVIGNFGCTIA